MLDFFKEVLNFDNPVKYAIPFFVLAIALEAWINYKERKGVDYSLKDSAASISMGLGSVLADLLAKSIGFFFFYKIFRSYALFADTLSFTLLGWVLLFFLDDFIFYWHHRFSHQLRILWAAHVQHHSSEHYNLSTALRQSWTEVFHKYILFAILPLLGFHPVMVMTQMSINLIYQFWIHTKHIDKLPWPLEFVFNTPSHHRVHHGSNIEYLDKNHAGTLIIWDRLFGTFQEEQEPVRYGITSNIGSHNPIDIASHEYKALFRDMRRAPNWSSRLKYLIMPPGWSHDGPNQTAGYLQAQKKKEELGKTG